MDRQSTLNRVVQKIRLAAKKTVSIIKPPKSYSSAIEYWEDRAKKYGARSVYNIGHKDNEMAAVTLKQQKVIFPFLQEALNGSEEIILDFGCGPGRFTAELSALIKGKAIGVEPIQHLIDLAPKVKTVEYKLMSAGKIPIPANSVDVAWICLVLGGIIDDTVLDQTVEEIERVLRPNGLLFLVENTSDRPEHGFWKPRREDFYLNLFPAVNLQVVSRYEDLDDHISIFRGRLTKQSTGTNSMNKVF